MAIPTLIDRVFRHFVTGLVQEGTAIKSEVLDVALSRVALARAVHISDACPQVIDALQDTARVSILIQKRIR